MKRINTPEKNWQKEMAECMKKKENFILITKDENLAKSLVKNELNAGALKAMLFGSSSTAGLRGIGGVAGTASLMALADPEVVTKAILAIVATICFALGAYFVYELVKMLLDKEYEFKIKVKNPGGEIEITAEPQK